MSEINQRAEQSRQKKAAFGRDLNLEDFSRQGAPGSTTRTTGSFPRRNAAASSPRGSNSRTKTMPAPSCRPTRPSSTARPGSRAWKCCPSPKRRAATTGSMTSSGAGGGGCRQIHRRRRTGAGQRVFHPGAQGGSNRPAGGVVPLSAHRPVCPARAQPGGRGGRGLAPHHHRLRHPPRGHFRPAHRGLGILCAPRRQAHFHHDPQLGRGRPRAPPHRGHGGGRRHLRLQLPPAAAGKIRADVSHRHPERRRRRGPHAVHRHCPPRVRTGHRAAG